MGEKGDLLVQLSELLGENMESVRDWIDSLGPAANDLFAQLMENPAVVDILLEQNPGICSSSLHIQ